MNTATLMQLMRHECIQTTMKYYVGRNAETPADAVWDAYEQRAAKGTGTGTVASEVPEAASTSEIATIEFKEV